MCLQGYVVYLNDAVIYSNTCKEHLELIRAYFLPQPSIPPGIKCIIEYLREFLAWLLCCCVMVVQHAATESPSGYRLFHGRLSKTKLAGKTEKAVQMEHQA